MPRRYIDLSERVAKVRKADGCGLAEAGAKVLADIVRARPRVEGVPARRQPVLWAPGKFHDPEPASPFLKFKRISDGYWWSAAGSAEVEIDYERGTVFYGTDGYLHVRIVLPEIQPSNPTGLPGRPGSKQLILAEFERRAATNRCDAALAGEVEALRAWCAEYHPEAPRPTPKTVENYLRAEHRKWLAERLPK